MSYSLELQSEAVIDIHEVFEWYQIKREGLGFDFIEEIEAGFKNICDHPQYYTSINKNFRRYKINRFPFLIIYEIEEDSIIINSVRHSSRNPKF